jgi:hypothetical protein
MAPVSLAAGGGFLLPKVVRGDAWDQELVDMFKLGSRDSNPDFLGNNQARYPYNTPQSSTSKK